MAANLKPGDIARFTYSHKAVDEDSGDRMKEVFVLTPNYQGKMHGLDLKRMTQAQREVLDAIMDPAQRGKPHRMPLVEDILRRMDPLEEIKSPVTFYSRFVKPWLRTAGDVYRTYEPRRMLNVVLVKKTHVEGHQTTAPQTNPNPLFKKV